MSLRLEYAVMQSCSHTLARHKQQIDSHHSDKQSLSSNATWPHSMYTKLHKQTQASSGNRHCCWRCHGTICACWDKTEEMSIPPVGKHSSHLSIGCCVSDYSIIYRQSQDCPAVFYILWRARNRLKGNLSASLEGTHMSSSFLCGHLIVGLSYSCLHNTSLISFFSLPLNALFYYSLTPRRFE